MIYQTYIIWKGYKTPFGRPGHICTYCCYFYLNACLHLQLYLNFRPSKKVDTALGLRQPEILHFGQCPSRFVPIICFEITYYAFE